MGQGMTGRRKSRKSLVLSLRNQIFGVTISRTGLGVVGLITSSDTFFDIL